MELNEAEKKLVAALRSGDYKQSKQRLRDKDGFCCLGVACDISGISTWDEDAYLGNDRKLPDAVMFELEWADNSALTDIPLFDKDRVRLGARYYYYNLATLNDDGLTFDQIADVIEAGLVRRSTN